MFHIHYANSDCEVIYPRHAWVNPARQVQKHTEPANQVSKDRNSLILNTAFMIQGKCENKDKSRRFKPCDSYVASSLAGGWGVGSEESKICKEERSLPHLTATQIISIERQQAGLQVASSFCYLHMANMQWQGGIQLPLVRVGRHMAMQHSNNSTNMLEHRWSSRWKNFSRGGRTRNDL